MFEKGDVVICIDDSPFGGKEGDKILTLGKTYAVIRVDDKTHCQILCDDGLSRHPYQRRFTKKYDIAQQILAGDL